MVQFSMPKEVQAVVTTKFDAKENTALGESSLPASGPQMKMLPKSTVCAGPSTSDAKNKVKLGSFKHNALQTFQPLAIHKPTSLNLAAARCDSSNWTNIYRLNRLPVSPSNSNARNACGHHVNNARSTLFPSCTQHIKRSSH